MRNLYERLPYNSEVQYDIAEVPEEARYWDLHMHMFAYMADVLNAIDWHIIASNTKNPPSPPKPIRRPDLKKKEPKPKGFWPGKTIVDRGSHD